MAYNQPIRQLHRLIRGDDRYGVGISRDDQYDAMACEDIASRFYCGFTMRTLLRTNCASVLGKTGTGWRSVASLKRFISTRTAGTVVVRA